MQGLGAALLVPQTMVPIITILPGRARGAAMGIWGAVAGRGHPVRPDPGRLLVTTIGWRWIFFVNVPIGVAVVVLTCLLVPDIRPARPTASTCPACSSPPPRCSASPSA